MKMKNQSKHVKKFTLLATVVLALTACTAEVNSVDEPVAAQISGTIGDNSSRASNNQWAEGDAIGVTMTGVYSNIEYTISDVEGKFEGTTMYFKNKVVPVNLTAYYPYSGIEGETPAVIETSTTIDRQNADVQPSFDFLYAAEENVTGANPDVAFSFKHMMSKLTIVFIKGVGMENCNLTNCELTGFVLDGSFNPVTGECGAKDTETAPLNMTPDKNGEWHPLILFPQTLAQPVTMKITDSDNQEYKGTLNFKDNRLESGNNYSYKITVSKTGLTINPSIDDWNEVPKEGNADSSD